MAVHPRSRRFVIPILSGTILLAGSGCVQAELDLSIRADDTVDGTLTIAWSQSFVDEAANEDPPTTLSDLNETFDPVFANLPEADIDSYVHEGYVGRTAAIDDEPLETFADFDGGEWGSLSIRNEDDEYVLRGHWDFTSVDPSNPAFEGAGEIVIRVEFPAEVLDHNGELDGRTVTWRMPPGGEYELNAAAAAEAGDPDLGLVIKWYIVTVVLLGVAAALVWKLWRRRSRRRPPVITTLGPGSPTRPGPPSR